MKIFHTGDWHIGKVFLNKNFIDEQVEVLDKLLLKVEEEDPDLIIIAGDIYDKSIPTIEAIELLNRTLQTLVVDLDKKVIIISGNHDSSDRLSFGAEILRSEGLYIVTDLKDFRDPITLRDKYGDVDIYPIPYVSPMKARTVLEEEEIKTYDDIAKYITDEIGESKNRDNRSICIYHGFLVGLGENSLESESERPLSIGGSDHIDVSYFKDFDYVALGHLHGPQRVKYDHIRYSGSLMKYSFSEQYQKKGVLSLEMGEKSGDKSNLKVDMIEIYPKRDMRIVEGSLGTIREKRAEDRSADDYIMVKLIEDGEIHRPKEVLDSIYPNILRIEIVRESKKSERSRRINLENDGPRDLLGIFSDFYLEVTGEDIREDRLEKLTNIIEDLGEDE